MKLNIRTIDFTASDRLHAYIEKKCRKFDNYCSSIVKGHVALKREAPVSGAKQSVEIMLQVPGQTLLAKVQGKTFEQATDLCTQKVIQQLKKYKGKVVGRA